MSIRSWLALIPRSTTMVLEAQQKASMLTLELEH
jgi:hypothetical protein